MKGLELSRRFYEQVGLPMLKEQFSQLLPLLAIGLAGSGSQCYGYDDDVSKDHDFEPGFCIFIPDETVLDRAAAFQLERAYARLPREFMGWQRSLSTAVGGNRYGVISISDFFTAKTGRPDGNLVLADWCTLPDYMLSEAVNGEVFYDGYGLFSEIRRKLAYFPEDVRRKKLAGHLLLMGQSGQYNYNRCIQRGETGAAQLSMVEFVKSALAVVFLLNKTYMPYYKWQFRALREMESLSHLAPKLERLISDGNLRPLEKTATVEEIAALIGESLCSLGISPSSELETLAYAVNATISDNDLRNRHILSAV